MVKTLFWIDYNVSPYIGYRLMDYAPDYETQNRVVWIKNPNDILSNIKQYGIPDFISFGKCDNILKTFDSISTYCINNHSTLPGWNLHYHDSLDDLQTIIKYMMRFNIC